MTASPQLPEPTPAEGRPKDSDRPEKDLHFHRGWTDLASPPTLPYGGATVWTGAELLAWGGTAYTDYAEGTPQQGGFALDPRTGKVTRMPPAPIAPRTLVASAWTGRELLIWGGYDGQSFQPSSMFSDGAAYDPVRHEWRMLPAAPISGRAPLSVWTGKELLVVGTQLTDGTEMDAAAYDPRKDRWTTLKEAPIRLNNASSVWTGKEMIIFGALMHGGNRSTTNTAVGAAYDPKRDSWRELPPSHLSPQASTVAWDGREMIAWDYLNDAEAFDPKSGTWRSLPHVPLDDGEWSPYLLPVGGTVYGTTAGRQVVLDHGRWRPEESPTLAAYRRHLIEKKKYPSGPTLISAGDAVLVITGQAKKDEWLMAAYRP